MKHNLKMLILAVIILAVLVGGYFFLTKWNPETEEKPLNELPTEKTEYLIDVKAKDIDFITVENGEQSYTLKNGEPASISGYSSHIIDSGKISSAIYNLSSVAISHKVNTANLNLSKIGLGENAPRVSVYLKDGSLYKILIGNSANFENEHYAMIEGESLVYTISSYDAQRALASPDTLRRTEICTLDSSSVKGITIEKGGKKEVSVVYDEDFVPQNEYIGVSFLVTYPYKNVTASLDKIESILKTLAPLSAERIVEENPSDLARYGLDLPYVMSITDNEDEITTVKMGSLDEDGKVYVMCGNVPVIYTADCPFYDIIKDAKADDFVERFISLYNINDVKKIEVTANDKTDMLEIVRKSEKKVLYELNEKRIKEDRFKKIYQAIIGITATDFTEAEARGKLKFSVKFTFNDDKEETVNYYIYDDRHCIVKGTNQIPCLVLTKDVERILKLLY